MNIILLIIVVIVSLPVAILAFEVLMALLPQRRHNSEGLVKRPKVAVLVPAHNEESILSESLLQIQKQLQNEDRLLVVADNCVDNTAQIASNTGAEVIERNDNNKIGKGFALDFAIHHLSKDAPQVVIIVDADCYVDDGAIDKLSTLAFQSGRPVQALYLMHATKTGGLKQRVAEFAWLVKDYVRPLGLARLGLPCQLMGSGMSFPWTVIRQSKLANSNIVEDLKLGLDLTKMGKAPLFCPSAKVSSVFPDSSEASRSQRTRWEHGHLITIITEFPKLFISSIFRGNTQLFVMSLDLAVPPLALLTLFILFVTILTFASLYLGSSMLPFLISVVTFGVFVSSILITWYKWGKTIISFRELLVLPIYVLSKVPLYFLFWFKRQKEWVRTNRD